jgi:hypothetical protein
MITKCEEFGVSFENKGKYPEIIPEPPKPPEPEKPKPGITWQGWLGLGILITITVVVVLTLIFYNGG